MMKNRNALLWLLPLIYAAWSCSDNMVDEDNVVVSPIVFAVDDVSATRADIVTKTNIQAKGFTVYASYQVDGKRANIFIHPCKVAYNSDSAKWLTEQNYYWPLTDTVSFYAYAPYDTINVTTSESDMLATNPTITYKVNKDVKKQTDILQSKAQNNKSHSKKDWKQEVKFQFGHTLSQLAFEVTNSSGQAISMNRLSMSGRFCTQAQMDVKDNGGWSDPQKEDTATYVIDLKKTSLANGETTSNADDSYLMIIPYTCTDLSIKISFVYQGTTYTDSTATFSATFVKANSYKYNIEIQDLSGLSTQAVAAPEVRQWE
jgi:hypothetical protein